MDVSDSDIELDVALAMDVDVTSAMDVDITLVMDVSDRVSSQLILLHMEATPIR